MVPNLTRLQSTSFLKLSLPLILEVTFVMLVTNLVVWMLSAYSDQLAGGISIAGQINNMIFLFFSIISMGTGILMAQSVGAKSSNKKQEIFSVSLFFALLFGVIGTILFFLFYKDVFAFYNLELDVRLFAEQYGLILAPFFIFNALFLVFNQTLYAHGKTMEAFLSLVFADSTILTFSYVLIFGVPALSIPSLGVVGAGIAIVGGRIIYFTALAIFIHKKLGLSFKLPKSNPFKLKTTKLLFKVGAPATLENLSYTFFMILLTRQISGIGTDAIVAKAYFDSLAMLTYFISSALSNSSAIHVGQLVGAGKYEEAESTIKFSIRLAFVATMVPSITLALLMRFIAPNYTDNQTIISLMVQIALVDILLELGRVINLVVNRAIKASGDARYPLISIIIVQWIFILPLIYVLTNVFHLGLVGIWIALAIDEFVRGINLWIRWKSKRWQEKSMKLNNSLLNH